MAAITIDGTALDCVDGPEGKPLFIGDQGRAFAGNLRSSIRAQKRQFSVTTVPVLEATWDTVRASLAMGDYVTVSGTVLSGDSITASCEAEGAAVPGLPGFFVIKITGQEV